MLSRGAGINVDMCVADEVDRTLPLLRVPLPSLFLSLGHSCHPPHCAHGIAGHHSCSPHSISRGCARTRVLGEMVPIMPLAKDLGDTRKDALRDGQAAAWITAFALEVSESHALSDKACRTYVPPQTYE